LKVLKQSFLQLQQKVHPDRFGGSDGQREEWAKLWSSRVNDAWKTLSNDRERAEYLVSFNHTPPPSDKTEEEGANMKKTFRSIFLLVIFT
jgi:DnaJ-domain-containing protein 1